MDEHEQIYKQLQQPEKPKPYMSPRTAGLGMALGAAKTILPVGKTVGQTAKNVWHMLIDPLFQSDSEAAAASQEFGKKVESGDPEATGSFLTQLLGLSFASRPGDVIGHPEEIVEYPRVTPTKPINMDALQAMLGDMFEPKEGGWKPDVSEMSEARAKEIGGFDQWMANVEKPHTAESHGNVRLTPGEVQKFWDRQYPVDWKHPQRSSPENPLIPASEPGGYTAIEDAQEGLRRMKRIEGRMNESLRGVFMREDKIEASVLRNVDKMENLINKLQLYRSSKQ
jgi:hypothetical protein